MTVEQIATIDCKLLSENCGDCVLFKPNENLMSASRISGGVFKSNCLSNYFECILEKFGDIELPNVSLKTKQND